MRTAVFAFVGMLFAVGLALSHAPVARGSSLPDATVDADRSTALMREDFAQAAGSMKTAIAEFYASTGAMPSSNAQAGLPDPSAYRGHTLRSATVEDDGSITLEFDAESGRDGGRIHLVADVAHANGMGVRWQCGSSDYPQIAGVLPGCNYVTAPSREVSVREALHAPATGR